MKKDQIIEILPQDTGGGLQRGVIYAANASRFEATHMRQELVTFASGLNDKEKLDLALNQLAPRIDAPRNFEYLKTNAASDFYSEGDAVRAIGSPFKKVESRGSKVLAKTENKGLTIELDKDGEGGLPNAVERAVARLTRRLYRNEYRRGVALLLDAAAMTEKTWNSASDPDQDLMRLVDDSGDLRGIDPTALLIGSSAAAQRLAALGRSGATNADPKLLFTDQQLADWLGIEQIIRSKVRFQSTSSAKSKVVGRYVIAFYADPNPGIDSPTNLARFVTPVTGGDFGVYVEDKPKFITVTVEHYSLLTCPSTLGIIGHNIK